MIRETDDSEIDISRHLTAIGSEVTASAEKVFGPSVAIMNKYAEYWKSGQAVESLRGLYRKSIGIQQDGSMDGGEAKKMFGLVGAKWRQWLRGEGFPKRGE
jgi:hypothetical protein